MQLASNQELQPKEQQLLDAILAEHIDKEGNLLPILHAIQDALDFIPETLIAPLAEALNLTSAEVFGVISFYTHFRLQPCNQIHIEFCRAEACQARGATELEQALTPWLRSHNPDATHEAVYCLGLCAQGPAAMLNQQALAHLTLDKLQAQIQAQGQIKTQTQTQVQTQGRDQTQVQTQAQIQAQADAHVQTQAQTSGQAPSSDCRSHHMQSIKIYIPMDSAAIAVGADDLVAPIQAMAQAHNASVEIIRNGTRGLLWLEPLVEIETSQGRMGYGPVTLDDLTSLFESGWLQDTHQGRHHPLCQGLVDEIPYLKNQERLTFQRVGIIDPLNSQDYAEHGGWQGLKNALNMQGDDIIDTVTQSGLRGRGGAAFPTGIKWKTVQQAAAEQKYIVANADEGDSGTFSDRILMEGDPFSLIEGMIIAGLAVNASRGYIYVRSEYPHAIAMLEKAIAIATDQCYLGNNILGSKHDFHLEVRKGAGAYICGEETSLLESLEGKRGVIRYKPPLPAIKGFMGMPTVVNNVVTLASIPLILAKGADFYKDFGQGKSYGTLAFQLTGNIKYGGLVEKAFGISLKELLYDYGGGSDDGQTLKAVQVGGPLGAYLSEQEWDTPLDYEAYAQIGAMIGHGGIVAFGENTDMAQMAEYAMQFCAVESCGKCTPCRIGSKRGVETISKVRQGIQPQENLALLEDLCHTMIDGSLCALGGMTPFPVLSALKKFPEDFTQDEA